jgi:histidinol dehydrogenase
MAIRLQSQDRNFETQFAALLAAKREQSADVDHAVREIIDAVRQRGDAAVIEFTQRYDRLELTPETIRLSPERIADVMARAKMDDLKALIFAKSRIELHHSRQLPADDRYTDAVGVEMGYRWTPVEAVGLYVPGGSAAYPSSVLMNAIPAKVTGVDRVAMVVPAPGGELNPLVIAAAHLCGVHEIYTIGGAQAVAALAYGTETIQPVAKIVGPGNAYVAAAKRRVFGTVGIDMIAGPSEVLVVADAKCDPQWIAADLLAQAEHDRAAQSILITDSAEFADMVKAAVEAQLHKLPRGDVAAASWHDYGAIIVVGSFDETPPLINRIAAEHLELAIDDPEALLAKVRNAGAVFLGRHTPEAIGDYVSGSNHVLPTARSARFSSGLGVLDFMKRTSILKLNEKCLAALGPAAMTLAAAEGLDAHRRSVAIRLGIGEADELAEASIRHKHS